MGAQAPSARMSGTLKIVSFYPTFSKTPKKNLAGQHLFSCAPLQQIMELYDFD